MIKFLHTADLHLGKVLHDYSLLEDQQVMLNQLREILLDTSYSALLIAGDVYDRSIPSPESVSLFSSFLENLRTARPDLAILILPGNHDSAARLGFGREIFARLGIHIASDPEHSFEPVIVSQNGVSCAFFLLPFLFPGCFHEVLNSDGIPSEEPVRSQSRLAEIAAARLEAARIKAAEAGASLTVLGAHLFTLGGKESESERIFLGTAEQVDAKLFAGFDYAGLGHLHRFQQPAANTWYSGSPLAYSVSESTSSVEAKGRRSPLDQEKVFLSVELAPGVPPHVTPIPVKPLRKLLHLRGSFTFFFKDSADDPVIIEAAKNYLEISLDDSALIENPLALLRPRFPFLLSVRQGEDAVRLLAEDSDSTRRQIPSGVKRSPVEDFTEFLTEIYGEANADKLLLFGELLAEIEGGEKE
jgi:exonuclease SbcD